MLLSCAGNDNLHMLTVGTGRRHVLRIDLEDFEGNKRYAEYDDFKVGSEKEKYELQTGNYSGDAG